MDWRERIFFAIKKGVGSDMFQNIANIKNKDHMMTATTLASGR